jgi:hypothetical protein
MIKSSSSVSFCGGRFLRFGDNGSLEVSRDGVRWAEATSGTCQLLVDAAFGNAWFVVIGRNGAILRSRDGVQWESKEHVVRGTLTSIAFGASVFVVIGTEAGGETTGGDEKLGHCGFILLSMDGQHWTSLSERAKEVIMPGALTVFPALFDITYGNGLYVAVGWHGAILVSAEALWWKTRNAGTTENLTRVAFGNGIFLASGENGSVLRSTDTVCWMPVPNIDAIQSVSFMNGQFIAFKDTDPAIILASPDGLTWARKDFVPTKKLASLACGNGRLLAAGDDGSLCTFDIEPLPADELRRPPAKLDPWTASSLLIRTLLREDVSPDIHALILANLHPGQLVQVELMMIFAAAHAINRRREQITFATLDRELQPGDRAGFARIVLRDVYKDRKAGPQQLDDVKDLLWIFKRPIA